VGRWSYRQVAVAGLALLLLAVVARLSVKAGQAVVVRAEVEDASRWLRGAVIAVDPGHGGRDPGAVVGQTLEKAVVLQISLTLRDMLEQHGAKVVLTRDEDEDLGGPISQELRRRVALVEENKAQLFVSIHANKDRCNCWGAQTFFQRSGRPGGKELAQSIQKQLRRLTPTTREALAADYLVLRTSPVPSAMVEVGFLTNGAEHQRLKEATYQKILATAVMLGIVDYMKTQVPQTRSQGQVGR